MNIKELIASKYPTLEIPEYVKGERRIMNGFDLNNDEYEFLHANVKTGQFFLYEYMEYKSDRKGGGYSVLHYPRVAIYLNNRLIDMALEIDFFNVRRNWENKREYKFTYTDRDGVEREYKQYPSEISTSIESIILWDDSVNVYGVWDKLPGWKELRKAYEKTIWFSIPTEEMRERKLKSVLSKKI
jgi:hypothetical protein